MVKIRIGAKVLPTASRTIDAVIAEFNIKPEFVRVANSVLVDGNNIQALLTVKSFVENTTYSGARLEGNLPLDVCGSSVVEVDVMGNTRRFDCNYFFHPDSCVYLGDDAFALVDKGHVAYVATRDAILR